MEIITFTDINNEEGVLAKPKPASEYIPDWYKKAEPYLSADGKKRPIRDDEGFVGALSTVKRCKPLWDMMTAGYIIETPYDIYVHQVNGKPYYQWGDNEAIAFQPEVQLQGHPSFPQGLDGVRIVHPWSITTPKGWSVLIIPPTHRTPSPIQTSSGIVDTDQFSLPFNMFFTLTDPKFEGMIPAGTPFAQVIPLKRASWKSRLGGSKEREKFRQDAGKMRTVFFDRYKKFWWQRKEYR